MTQNIATKNLVNFINRKGIKGSAIIEATGITRNVLYPCLQGRRELRADEFMAICIFAGANPEEMYKTEVSAQ